MAWHVLVPSEPRESGSWRRGRFDGTGGGVKFDGVGVGWHHMTKGTTLVRRAFLRLCARHGSGESASASARGRGRMACARRRECECGVVCGVEAKVEHGWFEIRVRGQHLDDLSVEFGVNPRLFARSLTHSLPLTYRAATRDWPLTIAKVGETARPRNPSTPNSASAGRRWAMLRGWLVLESEWAGEVVVKRGR